MRQALNEQPIFTRYDIHLEREPQQVRRVVGQALLEEVAARVRGGDDELIVEAVNRALGSLDPLEVIDRGLAAGMQEVSRLWAEGIYFLPQVVLSSDAMRIGISLCEQRMGAPMEKRGKIVTHTAEGDIHDIGQTIVNALLSAAGFEVINLGADVPVDRVIQACRDHRPLMLTGTALMTTTMSAFPRIASQLQSLQLNIPFVCGGGAVSEEFVTGFDLGIWGREASWATDLAEDALQGRTWQEMRRKWNG